MSYQSFLRSTSGTNTGLNTPSPNSINRKPAPGGNTTTPSIYANVTTRNTISTSPSTSSSNAPYTPVASTKSPALPFPLSSQPNKGSSVPPVNIPDIFTTGTPKESLNKAQVDGALQKCIELQKAATKIHEKRPFAAILLAPDNTTVLLTHFTLSHVQHAETELARLASTHFSPAYLARCTLVSTCEPCAMCAATIYWSRIGRVVYAASNAKLGELNAGGEEANMSLSLACRDVFKAGTGEVEIIGPVPGWEDRVVEESSKWWKDHSITGTEREGSVNGSARPSSLSSVSLQQSTPTTWTGEDSVLSSINDEGEYKAELDIDWMR